MVYEIDEEVKYVRGAHALISMKGKVIAIDNIGTNHPQYLIEFYDSSTIARGTVELHDGGGIGKKCHCWWVSEAVIANKEGWLDLELSGELT